MSDVTRLIAASERARAIAVELEQENADLTERIAAALFVVEQQMFCTCYANFEYDDDPCEKCLLRSELTVADRLTLDVVQARKAGAA